uniref:Ig-like domain-containing protein n=1 Tax=Seriola lalandi dorsalis TaxID=1841481 RepID=A0A3B4WZK4_SERLL
MKTFVPRCLCFPHVKLQRCLVNVTAAPGQTVSLPCRGPRDTDITVVEWSRAEPEPEQVFLYRDKKPDPQNQSPSFQNRVELRDRQMKDGDVSLTLKNVTRNDTGRYECRVQTEANSLPEPVSIIQLDVHQKGESVSGESVSGESVSGESVSGETVESVSVFLFIFW